MSLSGLIEQHALARPEATAVTYPGDGVELSLTYGELSRAANRLAAHLAARGVLPGDRVLTALRPGPDLVTAFLAIVRTGAAYVPVDPSQPVERRLLIARDSSAVAVVTEGVHAADYEGLGAAVVAVDTEAATIAARPGNLPGVSSGPQDAAYVCYTSGTTGPPKGVVIPHRAVLDLVTSGDHVLLTPDDVVAQAAGPAFDAVTFEIWSTLAAGARLVGLSRDTVLDPGRFGRAVVEHGVSVAFLTTALFHRIARDQPAAFAPLRTVLFGGEACDPRLVRQVLRAGPPNRLVHVYGPTEATAFATWHEVLESPEGARTLPIGRPIGATTAVVVGADGLLVGPGGSGELLLGGPGLATGYLGRPELTARRFVADLFTGSGAPLYRTGDRVQLREDGELEFTGRVDDRISLRGLRIDLGEIESVLSAHPAVAQSVVSVHEGPDGDRRLVAHVMPAAAPAAGRSEQITEWKEIYQTLYDDAAGPAGLEEDFAGWNSSYDALPLPVEEMRAWRSATVERVRELGGRRILEIGVGTGLLMAPLAADPGCEEYWATDFSPTVIEALQARTRGDDLLRGKVRLSCREAHDTAGLPAGHFDTVVLNSVVQYFPGLDYLRTVIERALVLLAPGGSILLGDLRNLDLARCMRTGVELARRGDGAATREAVRRSVGQQMASETELLLSPSLFAALARELPAVRAVDVRAKRGTDDNELTRYRYEVVLATAEPAADLASAPRLAWGADVASAADLRAYLSRNRPATLRLADVPNARVHGEYAAMRALDDGGPDVGEARALIAGRGPAPDPEELCAAAQQAGYRALPTWSATRADALDIVLVDPARIPAGPLTSVYAAPAVAVADCANTPTAFERSVALEVVLRGHLRRQLPDHMVPSALVALDALPLNSSGKVDREALPAPAFSGEGPGTQPGTPLQEIVRDLFAEVIGVPRRTVYADSDFFLIGGHSLAAARLLSRAREVLGADLGSRALYEARTPARFAALLGDAPAAATGPGRAAARGAILPLRLRGALNVHALEAALLDLGRRHEALRNSRLGSAGTRLRALAADDHLLELALPGDTVDLWSHLPLAAELAAAYGAQAGGGPGRPAGAPQAPPRAISGDVAPTAVPGGGSRPGGPADGSGPGSVPDSGSAGLLAGLDLADLDLAELDFALDSGLHERLAGLASEFGSTLFMVVHAALAALLSRLGAGDRITLAAPVPARDDEALRRAVGPYGRVLALSVDTSGDPAFTELLRRVREADLAAYRDGDAPLAVPGGVALSLLQESVAEFEAAGLTLRPESGRHALPAAELGLILTERHTAAGSPAGIAVTASFPRGEAGEAAAIALTGGLLHLLEAVVDDPHRVLSRLRVPSGQVPADPGALWSGVRQAAAPAQSAASLFAAQVARTPGAPAMGGMDYAELDARSDLLAHALIEHEAGPGTSVVTAISSPTGFAVAALAIAKTGAACLPLDPALGLPAVARPAVLLLDEAADRVLPATPGTARLVRDRAAHLLPADTRWPVREADRTRPLDPGAPVVLASAGSTGGLPPGAPRRAVTTVAIGGEPLAAAAGTGRTADTAWLVHGYPDAEVALGLLGALVTGSHVHLPDPWLSYDAPHEVLRWLREQGASVVLGSADDVLVGLARAEDVALTVSSGWPEGRLVIEQEPGGRTRPAPGYGAHVLDAQLRPAPPGTTGSLYIAGVGVAQGYPGLPGATGERFLPDPLAGGPDGGADSAAARMWRTGHAARVDEDGSLHILDHPWDDDPFTNEFGTFVVVADAAGHRALWPVSVPVPRGWHQTHAEDLYEVCLDHLDQQPSDYL